MRKSPIADKKIVHQKLAVELHRQAHICMLSHHRSVKLFWDN